MEGKWTLPESRNEATDASAFEGVNAAIAARAADRCDKASGRGPSAGQGELRGNLVGVAKERELPAWGNFKNFDSVAAGTPAKTAGDTRWVLTWKMVEGKEGVRARLVKPLGCVSLRP